MVKFQYVVLSVIYIGLIVSITYFLITGINKTPEVAQSYIQPGQAEKLEISARQETAAKLNKELFLEGAAENKTNSLPNAEPKFYPAPKYYVNYTKGLIFNPRFDFNIATDIAAAKKLGANIIVIELELEAVRYNEPSIYTTQGYEDWKPRTIQIINEAHKQGMHVELRTVTRAATDMRVGPHTDNETSYFANQTVQLFKQLASFAQEYQAYKFTTYAEVNNLYNWGNRPDSDVNTILSRIVGAVRHEYSGKIGVGLTSAVFVDVQTNYNLGDYNYLLLSVYPDDIPDAQSYHKFGAYSNRIYETLKIAKLQAGQHGVKELVIGSFGVNTDSSAPVPFKTTVSQQAEADMYDNIFNTHSNNTQGYTVAYDTFMYSVKGKPAEHVVGTWFRSLPN